MTKPRAAAVALGSDRQYENQHITLLTGIRTVFDRHDRVGIPTKKTTGSDAWRPSIPIDDDQGAQVRGGTVGCIC